MEKITLCGDNCLECPRYLAKTDNDLKSIAELWHKIGWRDTIVTNDEIRCSGCSSHKKCTYQLIDCVHEKGIEKCNQCYDYPCKKIKDMLIRSDEYKAKCKKICTQEEYQMLERSFFNKEENLKK